jgi:hypothetical protein
MSNLEHTGRVQGLIRIASEAAAHRSNHGQFFAPCLQSVIANLERIG